MRRTTYSALIACVFALSACSALNSLGSILGTGMGTQQQQGQIAAEIQQVDVNGQRIYVVTQDGQSGSLRFDSQTQVIYRQQRYSPTSLQRGDIIAAQVQQTSSNELYAYRIDVTQSVQERRAFR